MNPPRARMWAIPMVHSLSKIVTRSEKTSTRVIVETKGPRKSLAKDTIWIDEAEPVECKISENLEIDPEKRVVEKATSATCKMKSKRKSTSKRDNKRIKRRRLRKPNPKNLKVSPLLNTIRVRVLS